MQADGELEGEGRAAEPPPEGQDWLRLVAELKASERRYRSLVEATASIVWRADAKRGFVDPQPPWEKYTGQSFDEYAGLGWVRALHPDDRQRVEAVWREASRGSDVYQTEGRLWHAASGSYRWCVTRGSPLTDDRGEVREWVGTCTDIHDQVENRQEAVAASARLETLLAAEQAARREAEKGAERAWRLGRITAALATALTEDAVADSLAGEVLPALGADTFAVALGERGELRVVRVVGLTPDTETVLRQMAAGPENPFREVVTTGRPVFFGSAAEHAARYPHLGEWRAAAGMEGRAHLPLIAEGRVLGALYLGFVRRRDFSEADRVFLTTVAAVAAQAFQRARLLAAEQAARQEAEDAARRLHQLQDISDVALSRLPIQELVTAIRDRVRIVLGVDTVRIMLLDPDGAHLRLAAISEDDPAGPNFRIPMGRGFTGRVATARAPIVLADASAVERVDPVVAEVASIAGVPLLVGSRLVGVLHVGTFTPREFTGADVDLLELAAERIAVAIDRSRAFESQRAMARMLQSALLPPSLPVIPGARLSARYIAAGEGTEVGGDFYDVFPLGGDAWLAIVGDVCGRGPTAAAMTGLARHSVRAVAQEQDRPREILARLNATLGDDDDQERFATAVCARLEPRSGGLSLVLASGGHCRPMVVRADGRTEVVPVSGMLLGVFPEVELEEATVDLSPGDSAVLYTDGVVEAQGEDGMFGEDRLAELLAANAGRTSAELAERVEDAVWAHCGGAPDDDLAVLVVQAPIGVPADAAVLLDVRLPAGELAPRAGRRAVGEAVAGSLTEEALEDVGLAVSELVTNAILHGRPQGAPNLRVVAGEGRLRIEVRNRGRSFPFPGRPAGPLDESGRGLAVVRALAASAGLDEEGNTVCVWATFEVPGVTAAS